MRFHLLSLVHTQTTQEYVHCAYTTKVVNMARMLKSLGHEVFLYASEENDAPCDELITCIKKQEQRQLIGIEQPTDNLKATFDSNTPYWQLFNRRIIANIAKRAQPKDFILTFAGLAHKPVADVFPALMTVEAGIGYSGVFSAYRVFESYAWMHVMYGATQGFDQDGRSYDVVIPNAYNIKEFPFSKNKDDYFLFIGRLIDRKGYQIAVDVAKLLGKRLVIAGQGQPPNYGEYVGVVGVKERGRLMSRAKAVFVPTQYVGPFEGVSVEANLCGTPIITTDWGSFAENNIHGVTGYRTRTLGEAIWAAQNVGRLDPRIIRNYAVANFSMNRVKYQYQAYFEQLMELWGPGWTSGWNDGIAKYKRYTKYLPMDKLRPDTSNS